MSQLQWDRSTLGGAGEDAHRRRMLGAVAAGLVAGLAAGFVAGMASSGVSADGRTLPEPAELRPVLMTHDAFDAFSTHAAGRSRPQVRFA